MYNYNKYIYICMYIYIYTARTGVLPREVHFAQSQCFTRFGMPKICFQNTKPKHQTWNPKPQTDI